MEATLQETNRAVCVLTVFGIDSIVNLMALSKL